MDDRTCATCIYLDKQASPPQAGYGSHIGRCRCNPPLLLDGGGGGGVWPLVSATDWCGEWDDGLDDDDYEDENDED